MNSSTSSSRAALAFALALLLILVPYELAVRAAERRYGMKPANFLNQTTSPKIETFCAKVAAGERFDTLLIGSSEVEFGFRPDVLAAVTGRTYNLGIRAVSSIAELEMIERLRIRPKRVIIGVGEIDLTVNAVNRGNKLVDDATAERRSSFLSDAARAATFSLLHSAAPDRRRNFGQWLELLRDGGDLLAFLNNADATARMRALNVDGYVGVDHSMASLEDSGGLGYAKEYERDHKALLARFASAVRRLRRSGIDVVLVRPPVMLPMRKWLDSQSTFGDDVRGLAAATGADVIDGAIIVEDGFTSNPDNYFDANHLNLRGSTRFSRALAAALLARDLRCK